MNLRNGVILFICSLILAMGLLAGCGGTDTAAPATSAPAAPTAAPLSPIEDMAAHLELSAMGRDYVDMDAARRDALLRDYGELTEGYRLHCRESSDGDSAYILGVYEGEAENREFWKMFGLEADAGA